MSQNRYERAKEILLRVIDLPEAERKAILDQACAGDPELRAEVEELLAHDDHPASSRPSSFSGDSATVAIPPPDRFTPGQILGHRYRIVRLLGRGGMGEVWQAYDLKLQVDVALKSIRTERFSGEQGLEFLRREVRSAREVMSPNVCRIFDLVEEDGQEFVSMEYIDGETLLDILLERGPLELQEATRIASQFLSGLEAIHQAGLVHRDVKPENVMVTRTGRVVLMDFGIAKGVDEDRRGTIAGTPAYMAPEQLRGESLDARADIFAAGVVLAEMGAPEGIKVPTSRESIWKAVRQTPVRLFEGPWRPVLERAVSSEPSGRYASARELARALEEVALRAESAEEKHPYPGLDSFTEADAEFFFGREAEVEAVWKKLARSNLLAIIGPSGAGKTSFLHAGLIPAEPSGWRHVLLRPGSSPFVALAQAFVAELAGDPDAMRELVEVERPEQALAAVRRWRGRHDHALIVVDQFEELFTLCRPETQASFADLMGRLADEADVHVLLVMRDDFMFRCHEHSALSPVFADMTPLGPPTGSSLRRALVQPAILCGYRFEDESLADEMITAIEGERGALPMLAFAAARLWEDRDRERGLLTRESYERTGGVSGALAQHAEVTLERIGTERQPIVREIFRNLVTAQGTRAVPDVDELLSVFPDRDAAGEALYELINARLLTSFELPATREDGREQRRVEIVHESLLSHWPRLVRWQTQDTEGAQLRDQLRQAAQLWKERRESEDLLWAGTAFKEFELWRERYPGGLTATEEAFARAMVEKAGRLRRRRQQFVAGTIAALVLVAVGLTSLWVRARTAQRRSEATKLLVLGRNEIEVDPTAALAYAIKSVETADTPAGRRLALEALAQGPMARGAALREHFDASFVDFSPDGSRLAVGGCVGVRIYSRDGSAPIVLRDPSTAQHAMREPQFAPDGDRLVFTAGEDRTLVRVWSLSEGRDSRTFQMEGITLPIVRGERVFLITDRTGRMEGPGVFAAHIGEVPRLDKWTHATVRAWGFDEKDLELVGRWNLDGVTSFDIDPSGRRVAYAKGRGVYLCPVGELGSGRERLVGGHTVEVQKVVFDSRGERLASGDSLGEIRLWSLAEDSTAPTLVISAEGRVSGLRWHPSGSMLAAACGPTRVIQVWDLNGPMGADPIMHRRRSHNPYSVFAFDPTGRWLAAVHMEGEIDVLPVARPNPYVLHGTGAGQVVAFSPDGELLAAGEERIRIWSLDGSLARVVGPSGLVIHWMVLDPRGRFAVLATPLKTVLVSLDDGTARELMDGSSPLPTWVAAVSVDGRLVAGAPKTTTGIRVWDLESGTRRVLQSSKGMIFDMKFSEDGRLFTGDDHGNVEEWNLQDGRSTPIGKTRLPFVYWLAATRDARMLLAGTCSGGAVEAATYELVQFDLKRGTSRIITSHGDRAGVVTFDLAETLMVTADADGVVRVGSITGDEPHMLIGKGSYLSVAVHPDGNWIAAGAYQSPIIRLWRMPEGRPLHTLPRRELLNHLRAMTNLRAVSDRSSVTGYHLDWAPFPGWEEVPTTP